MIAPNDFNAMPHSNILLEIDCFTLNQQHSEHTEIFVKYITPPAYAYW